MRALCQTNSRQSNGRTLSALIAGAMHPVMHTLDFASAVQPLRDESRRDLPFSSNPRPHQKQGVLKLTQQVAVSTFRLMNWTPSA